MNYDFKAGIIGGGSILRNTIMFGVGRKHT